MIGRAQRMPRVSALVVALAVSLLNACCRPTRKTVPAATPSTLPPDTGWVEIQAGTRLSGDAVDVELTTPAVALFRVVPRPKVVMPPGRTVADRKAVEQARARQIAVEGARGVYWVNLHAVAWSDRAVRMLPAGADAAEAYRTIEDSLGVALAQIARSCSRDMIELSAREASAPETVTLRTLDQLGLDPAAYKAIARDGAARYQRPPDWGRHVGPRQCP